MALETCKDLENLTSLLTELKKLISTLGPNLITVIDFLKYLAIFAFIYLFVKLLLTWHDKRSYRTLVTNCNNMLGQCKTTIENAVKIFEGN